MATTSGISQAQLVTALHRRGYETVNIRQVIDWRARGLLPPFDVHGSGRGRSQGREASKWSDSENLTEQSVWIMELLTLYGTYNRLYVPLWLLGYPVPYDCICEALSQPLTRTLRHVERECGCQCNMEDALSDSAHRLAARLEKEEPIFHMPPDAIELILNVFINPDYDLTDEGAFQAWQIWQQHCAEQQRRLSNDAAATTSAVDSLDSLMSQAMIAKQYLSVAAIKNAVNESTSEIFE